MNMICHLPHFIVVGDPQTPVDSFQFPTHHHLSIQAALGDHKGDLDVNVREICQDRTLNHIPAFHALLVRGPGLACVVKLVGRLPSVEGVVRLFPSGIVLDRPD